MTIDPLVLAAGVAMNVVLLWWFVVAATTSIQNRRRLQRFSAQIQREHQARISKWPSETPAEVAWDSLICTIPNGTSDEIFDSLMVYVKRIDNGVPKRLWPGLICNAIVKSRSRTHQGKVSIPNSKQRDS